MSRVIAIVACGLVVAACSMSMPSMDFFRSGPATEVLRIESEPPGADARTAEGQSCRTPCELTVPVDGRGRDLVRAPGLQSADHQCPRRSAARGELCRSGAADPHAAEPGLRGADAFGAVAPKEAEIAGQEESRREEEPAPTASPRPLRPRQPPADPGPGERLPVELSLAAAPASAIARKRRRIGRCCGNVAAAMDALADIRQSP